MTAASDGKVRRRTRALQGRKHDSGVTGNASSRRSSTSSAQRGGFRSRPIRGHARKRFLALCGWS